MFGYVSPAWAPLTATTIIGSTSASEELSLVCCTMKDYRAITAATVLIELFDVVWTL